MLENEYSVRFCNMNNAVPCHHHLFKAWPGIWSCIKFYLYVFFSVVVWHQLYFDDPGNGVSALMFILSQYRYIVHGMIISIVPFIVGLMDRFVVVIFIMALHCNSLLCFLFPHEANWIIAVDQFWSA